MRSFLNSVLAFIGAESLTDEEYATVDAVVATYNQFTYEDLSEILTSREAISDFHERLKYHYIENGYAVSSGGPEKSNIFIGGDLSKPITFTPSTPTGKLTKNRVVVSSEAGFVSASSITKVELETLSGITANVQEQIDALQDEIDDIDTGGGGGTAEGGGDIVDTSSYASPSLITTTISIPTDIRARKFVAGSPGAVVAPTLAAGALGQELFLFGTNDANTVELNSSGNLFLNGPAVLRDKSIICLHWIADLTAWVEAYRNEI